MEKANPIYVSDYILFIQSTKFSNGENGNVIQQSSKSIPTMKKFKKNLILLLEEQRQHMLVYTNFRIKLVVINNKKSLLDLHSSNEWQNRNKFYTCNLCAQI